MEWDLRELKRKEQLTETQWIPLRLTGKKSKLNWSPRWKVNKLPNYLAYVYILQHWKKKISKYQRVYIYIYMLVGLSEGCKNLLFFSPNSLRWSKRKKQTNSVWWYKHWHSSTFQQLKLAASLMSKVVGNGVNSTTTTSNYALLSTKADEQDIWSVFIPSITKLIEYKDQKVHLLAAK